MKLRKENEKNQLKEAVKIKITKNGPYIVSGEVPLQEHVIVADSEGTATEWQPSTKYESHEKYSICRCGHSKNKPFCDGTHIKVRFVGTETADEEIYLNQPKEIDGPTLKLADIENLCASARFCHRAGGIWKLVPESDDPEKKQIAIEETFDCPSGRLVVMDKKTGKIIEPKFVKSIVLIEDPAMNARGPIWVRGGIPVESANGKEYRVRNRVTLCRCEKSKNKPFCDSSHYPKAETVEKVTMNKEKEKHLLMELSSLSGYHERNVDDSAVLRDFVVFYFCSAPFYVNALDILEGSGCFVNSILGCLLPPFF